MLMTQYMSLLMANSPYNLIFFMVVPMVIAETIAITEIVLLFSSKPLLKVHSLNSICTFISGIVMLVLGFLFIKELVLPANEQNLWKGWIDYASALLFMVAVVPLVLMSLLQINLIFRKASKRTKMAVKIVLLSIYLVTSHAAMVFGMLDPALGMTDTPKVIETLNMRHMSMNMKHDLMSMNSMPHDLSKSDEMMNCHDMSK
ncbi:permease [Succinatimonas sp. CAG:777]|nr:permease [Succinatimonas sp. CAG:777]